MSNYKVFDHTTSYINILYTVCIKKYKRGIGYHGGFHETQLMKMRGKEYDAVLRNQTLHDSEGYTKAVVGRGTST